MSKNRALQLSTEAEQALTPQQKRFNTLVRQIEQARQKLAAWHDSIGEYRQAYTALVLPLQDQLMAARRESVLLLDALYDEKGWTRAERETLSEMVRLIAGGLLRWKDDDAALHALYSKHSVVDFDTERQETLQATREMMEQVMGLDLGDPADIKTDEDLEERLQQKLREQQEAREAAQAERTARRRQSAAQQRREAEEQQTTQSVREIYRKLASALHPDRESDAKRREQKTALMQKVNRAYAAGDLLALLELQLQVEQVDLKHIAGAGAEKLQHYNQVLAAQLAQLKQEIHDVEAGFCMDFGVQPHTPLGPGKLGGLIRQNERALRADLAQLQHESRLLADRASAKRWLKRQRQMLQEAASEFDFF